MIHTDVSSTIGKTPMIELTRMCAGMPARVAVKLESRNPCGSIKDRVGFAMIEDAERRGLLTKGATIVEATSGNTGIALAFLAAARGYRIVLTMPERMSRERIALLKYLGAEVVLTPGTLMREARAKAEELAKTIPGSVQLEQFENPANPAAHRATTALEIWDDTEGALGAFVAGVGTGGTITGVGQVLKDRRREIRIIAVEPANAAVLSGGAARNHVIQGIGAGFVPPLLDRSVIDEILTVTEDEAFDHARRLAREEGILAGVSSGAAVAAALAVARRPEMKRQLVVTIVADTGERYMNTPLMSELVSQNSRG